MSYFFFNFYFRILSNKEVIFKWNEIVKMVVDENNIGIKFVYCFFKEIGCLECYFDNVEYFEKFDFYGFYLIFIYCKCDGDILVKVDVLVVECIMRYILIIIVKIVYKVLDLVNLELKNVYKLLGRFV